MTIYIGDKPIGEVKSTWEVLRAIFTFKELDCTFWEKCKMGWLIVLCRFMAWRAGKDLRATLTAMASAIEQVKREEAEHDF